MAASAFARGSLYITPLVSGRYWLSSGTMVPLVPSMEIDRIRAGSTPFSRSWRTQSRTASSAAARQWAGDCSYSPSVSATFSVWNATDFAAATPPRSSATAQRTPCVPTSIPIKYMSDRSFLRMLLPL